MSRTRIAGILSDLQLHFTRKQNRAAARLRAAGISDRLEQRIASAELVAELPTFRDQVNRPLSPMLEERFRVAGRWTEGTDIWLASSDMHAAIRSPSIRGVHQSLRDNWEGSAPMLYQDDQLGLFGVTEDVPEDLIYIVWAVGNEPEIWRYSGMRESRYRNLAEFLESQIEPE